MTQTIDTIKMLNNKINITEREYKTYRLMYLFGAWVTKAEWSCESDDEAIYDATACYGASKLSGWAYSVALFEGSRMVKLFKK